MFPGTWFFDVVGWFFRALGRFGVGGGPDEDLAAREQGDWERIEGVRRD